MLFMLGVRKTQVYDPEPQNIGGDNLESSDASPVWGGLLRSQT